MTQLKGNLETIYAGRGFLLLTGWLATEAGETPDGASLVTWTGEALPIRAFHEREDLTGAGLGACAFQIAVPCALPLSPDATAALTMGEAALTFPVGAMTAVDFAPLGTIEKIGIEGIWGWLYDPGLTLSGNAPVLRYDGWLEVPLALNQPRTDLPFEAAATQPFGFAMPLRALLTAVAAQAPETFLLDGGLHRYELIAGGRVVATREVDLRTVITGRIETVNKGTLLGWAVAKDKPEFPVDIEILANDVPCAVIAADRVRSDLKRQKISQTAGGYRFPLAQVPADGDGETRLTARPFGSTTLLRGELAATITPQAPRNALVPYLLPPLAQRGISIIIPIYNAAADLALCLETLTRWTTLPARLILIDDASPERDVGPVLDQYEGRPGIEIVRSAENRGFTRTCNHGMRLAGQDDVVLLNSDTKLGPRWLEGLRAAAYSHPRHGSATPMSTNAGAFSFPHASIDNALAGGSIEIAARLAAQGAGPYYPTVPTGHGFCLYLRRDCLDETGLLDEDAFPRGYGEENDLCMRAGLQGWTHVLDDRTLVFHKRSASFKDAQAGMIVNARKVLDARYPEFAPLVGTLKRNPLIEAARWRVQAGARRLPAERIRPRLLFVVSTETGGTPQTNRDLMTALSDRYEPWLLRCDSKQIVLYRADGGVVGEPVETHDLGEPIRMADHRSAEYDAIVSGILLRRSIELVHIRHLGWQSLDLPRTVRQLGIPVVLSFHDFYTVCPTIKLLDENRNFCGGRCTEGDGYCQAELWPAGEVPHLKHRFVHRWRDKLRPVLEACDAFVTTSNSAAGILTDTYAVVSARGITVIPHGRSFESMEQVAAGVKRKEKLRVLLPGNLSPAKGSHLVNAMAAIADPRIEFHIMGDPGVIQPAENVIIHGRYARHEFAEKVAGIAPHVGAIFSIWAETWSHTLTEMWSCGVPVLALDIGAVAERIKREGGGWLMPVASTPEELLESLRALLAKPKALTAAREQIAGWQEGEGIGYDVVAMAAQYDRLYRRLLGARRAYGGAPGIRVALVLGEGEALAQNDADAGLVLWQAPSPLVAFPPNVPVEALILRGDALAAGAALAAAGRARGMVILAEKPPGRKAPRTDWADATLPAQAPLADWAAAVETLLAPPPAPRTRSRSAARVPA